MRKASPADFQLRFLLGLWQRGAIRLREYQHARRRRLAELRLARAMNPASKLRRQRATTG